MARTRTTVVDRAGAETPVEVVKQHPLVMILVRAGRTFLQTFVALLLAVPAAGQVLDIHMTGNAVVFAASGALFSGIVSFAQNLAEYLGQIDRTHPEVRA